MWGCRVSGNTEAMGELGRLDLRRPALGTGCALACEGIPTGILLFFVRMIGGTLSLIHLRLAECGIGCLAAGSAHHGDGAGVVAVWARLWLRLGQRFLCLSYPGGSLVRRPVPAARPRVGIVIVDG